MDPAIIVGGCLGPAQHIIREADHIAIAVSLLTQQAGVVEVGIGGKGPSSYRRRQHIAEVVIGKAVDLALEIIGPLDGGQVSLVISILHRSGICNGWNQKKCPGT